MRLAAFVLGAVCLASPLACAPNARAQSEPVAPACDGSLAVVRVSDVKPGKMDEFLQAVSAQATWYKSHGLTQHVIYAARIDDLNPATGAATVSQTQAMTFHFNALSGAQVAHDAAWETFVKMFRESSTIKTEYHVCTTMKI